MSVASYFCCIVHYLFYLCCLMISHLVDNYYFIIVGYVFESNVVY